MIEFIEDIKLYLCGTRCNTNRAPKHNQSVRRSAANDEIRSMTIKTLRGVTDLELKVGEPMISNMTKIQT